MLHINGDLVMSDTPGEAWEHSLLYDRAYGRVLINGLGLGLGLKAVLTKPAGDSISQVETVKVIEVNEDVIALVGPRFTDDLRVEIVHADALTYQPKRGEKYNCVWHDIWTAMLEPGTPEWSQHLALHRKWRKRLYPLGWQGSWSGWRVAYIQRGEVNFLPDADDFKAVLAGRIPANFQALAR